jgi:periplasmic copper chaperone A
MLKHLLLATALLLTSASYAHPDKAHVDIADLWIRSTVEGQMGTGGFMKITAREDLQLVGVTTPISKAAEVHEMRASKTDANVMEMRPIQTLDLQKGKTVELKPGGHHLMLMDLKQPLKNGSTVPLTLHFKDAKGATSKLDVTATVGRTGLPAATGGASQPAMPSSVHKH